MEHNKTNKIIAKQSSLSTCKSFLSPMLPNERTGKTDQTGQDAQADLSFPWAHRFVSWFCRAPLFFYFLALMQVSTSRENLASGFATRSGSNRPAQQ